jgi:tetratricopeptide (TPR) repeat protein
MGKHLGFWLVDLCLALIPFAPASAQTDAWRSLIQQADILYQQGWYEQAAAATTKALEAAERDLGPEHPDVDPSLNYLAELYGAQGQYVAAEHFYRRSLHIRETHFGPHHVAVAGPLEAPVQAVPGDGSAGQR